MICYHFFLLMAQFPPPPPAPLPYPIGVKFSPGYTRLNFSLCGILEVIFAGSYSTDAFK